MIPPARDAVRPHMERAAALSMAYSALKAGKFLPKKTGKKEETIMPPKFLKEEAMRVFLAQGREKTRAMFSQKAAMGFLPFWASNSAFSFFSFSFYFSDSDKYLPLSGSLTSDIVITPKMEPTMPMIP